MESKELYLREVRREDMDLLYRWANDRTVRQNAFHTEPISRKEHERWFERRLRDQDEIQYILMCPNGPAGQIRFSPDGEKAEIDYSIDASERGKGYGKEMVRLAVEKIRFEHPEIRRIIAKVKPGNTASAECFRKNGFTEIFRQYELKAGS